MRLPLKILIISIAVGVSGCAAVNITQSGESDLQYRPHYEESKHFFLWGLFPEHHINVKEICPNQPVKQMQTKYSAWDVLWSGLSLGLYTPRTAKVWCEPEDKS